FFSSRRRHTRFSRDWSSDVCSSDLSLQQQGIAYTSHIVKATPLNTLLWSITAEAEDGFYTGFYSLLDQDTNIEYDFEPRQAALRSEERRVGKEWRCGGAR